MYVCVLIDSKWAYLISLYSHEISMSSLWGIFPQKEKKKHTHKTNYFVRESAWLSVKLLNLCVNLRLIYFCSVGISRCEDQYSLPSLFFLISPERLFVQGITNAHWRPTLCQTPSRYRDAEQTKTKKVPFSWSLYSGIQKDTHETRNKTVLDNIKFEKKIKHGHEKEDVFRTWDFPW